MVNLHTAAGLLLLGMTLGFLGVKYFLTPRPGRFRWWGWAGIATIAIAEVLLFLRIPVIVTFFTPIAWTGYILLVDALIATLRGRSLLSNSPRRVLSLAFWSVPLWLIFEAYNLRLENWTYVGVPENPLVLGFGYAWSFATIWPAIFETASFISALGLFANGSENSRRRFSSSTLQAMVFTGFVMVLVPVVIPANIGAYLFGAVWIGFILLLDPLNYRWNGFSFLRRLESGETGVFWSFVTAGWVCGILWEFWNYWAAAKWIYIFPIGQNFKIFEMPALGFLGFLPFALECKVMYEFLRTLRRLLTERRSQSSWEMAGSER